MKTSLAVLIAWLAVGLTIEGFAFVNRYESRAAAERQQAAAEKQRAVEHERAIAARNLHQAEVFITMCLDPVHRYAYLGPLVFECKATATKHRLYL